jgi:hypothetical protein
MNKAYLLVICLVLTSFIGCIEDSNDLEKISSTDEENTNDNEEDTIEPVGEGNTSSLEKRVSELEATIAEYEQPKVYFLDLSKNNYSWASYMTSFPDYEFYKSDDGYLNCFYLERSDLTSCSLNALYYDVDGMIEAYSWEGSEADMEYTGVCQDNTDPLVCLIGTGGTGWIAQDVCTLASVNQTLTLSVYDNDDNVASASYELDYFTNCGRIYEPDQIPEISFHVEESSSGVYHVEVISVSEEYHIENYNYFLKDETGSTHVGGNGFGEIAMQMIDGQEHGIDTSYSDSCGNDCNSQLESRASNVSNDDGADYPVHFSDNDRDGKLSAGDQFMVYGLGNSANGPAEDNWRLDIQFVISGDIVGTALLL